MIRSRARIVKLPSFAPGDLLFFSGRGFESRFIALITCNLQQILAGQLFSHVGFIADHGGGELLYESTTLCNLPCVIQGKVVQGVQAHPPAERVAKYDGHVWRLRLARENRLSAWQRCKLSDFARSKIGDGYDYEEAAISGTRLLRMARWVRPNLDKLFCSEYAMAALRACDVVDHDLNPAAYNPARMARDLVWWRIFQWVGAEGSESVRIK